MLINNDTIIKDSDPFIREKSQPVKLPLDTEDEQLLRSMYQYVEDSTDPEKAEKYNLRPAVGISAIQVGSAKQMTAIIVNETDRDGNPVKYSFMLVNPKIVSYSVQQAYLGSGEGCLSVVEDHPGYILRSARIKVKAFDLIQNKDITIRAGGYLAIVMQHEFEHFKGILFYDHIDPKNPFKVPDDAIEI